MWGARHQCRGLRVWPGRTPGLVAQVTTRPKSAGESRRPQQQGVPSAAGAGVLPGGCGHEPVTRSLSVVIVTTRRDRLTSPDPKMILVTYKSDVHPLRGGCRSEEHTSELQSLR